MKKYILIGIVVFFVAMLAYIPANVAAKFLPKNIVANQFQGSVWNGSAANLVVDKYNYGAIKWKLKSSCLLLLKLCADIQQVHNDVESSFHLKMRGSTEIINLIARGNAAVLSPFVKNYGISLTGNFDASMDNIHFDESGIHHLSGNINFSTLDINGVLRVSMGDVDSAFEPMNDFTQININNNQGHVDLAGGIQLYNDLSYELDMIVSANEISTDAVINGLKYIGEQQADGSVNLRQRGQL